MTRPADWSPLGLDSDPIPGDPERISQEAAQLSRVATTITGQIAALRKIGAGGADGTLVGEYADTIRSSADDLADQLGKVVGRYQKASQALNQWVPELEYLQSESVQALRAAEDAARRQQASAPLNVPQGQQNSQQETTQRKQQDVARTRALQQADSDAVAHRRLDNAVAHRDSTAGQTAAAINHAIDDGAADSWWDQFKSFVDHFAGVIKVVCTVLEVIATILAIVALFIPGLDLIVMLAIAATALALIGRTVLAATGNGSWMQVATDAFALLTFGSGRIIGSAAEGAAGASEAGGSLARAAVQGDAGVTSLSEGSELLGKLANAVEDESTAAEAARQIFRIVGPEEAADIARTGVYRTVFGLEGKYFFPTEEQALNLNGMFMKVGMGGPYTLTSGLVAQSVLDAADPVSAAGEGAAYWITSEMLPSITNVTIHGMLP
jgi:hypothetical protein